MSQLLEVSLGECLEVKDTALNETELWAVLTQALERIDSIFNEGKMSRFEPMLPITPDSILLCLTGQIDLSPAHKSSAFYEDCLPPEFLGRVSFTVNQYEKMFIYSLGMSIYSAADYNLTSEEELGLSGKLDELLSTMCCKNPEGRVDISSALKACSGSVMTVSPILDLYRLVLGGASINMRSVEEKSYDYSYEAFKPNASSMKSQPPSEANTIHYILLDRGVASGSQSREASIRRGKQSRTEGIQYSDKTSVPSDADVEETYSRLNSRRRKLESLRKGLRRLDDSDDQFGSLKSSLARLSRSGLLKSTPNLNVVEDRQQLNFLSGEYEWLDRRAKEIDDWRKTHMRAKEMIITPDPVIREAEVRLLDPEPKIRSREAQDQTDAIIPIRGIQISNQSRQNRSLEGLVASAKDASIASGRPQEETKEEEEEEEEQRFFVKIEAPVQVDQEIRAKKPDLDSNVDSQHAMSQLGPEFRRTYPVANLIVREATLVSESNVRHARVLLLDGAEVDVVCCPSNTGQQLNDCIAAYLMLKEPNLFGLALPKDGELFFLERQVELRKVAPLDWNQKKKFRSRQTSPMLLHFCVQYFVPNFNYISHQSTLHLYYLQLRLHILHERLHINDIQSNFHAAALAAQAEYGDKTEETMDLPTLKDYLPPRIIRKSGEVTCMKELLSKWDGFSTLPQMEAEMLFVKKCMGFREYAFHFYRLFKAKYSIDAYGVFLQGSEMTYRNACWVGIGLPGIVISREFEETRVREIFHQWGNTLKVSYNRHRFSISENDMKQNYIADSHKKCHYLLQLSEGQHFFKLTSKLPRAVGSAPFISDLPGPITGDQPDANKSKRNFENSKFRVEGDSTPKNRNAGVRFQEGTKDVPNQFESPNKQSFILDASRQEYERPVDVRIPGADGFMNYLQDEPSISLPKFNLGEIENYSVSNAGNSTKPEVPSQIALRDFPDPSSKSKAPVKAPRTIGDARKPERKSEETGNQIILPSMNLNETLNAPQSYATPSTSGVELRPLFKDEQTIDTSLPRLNFSKEGTNSLEAITPNNAFTTDKDYLASSEAKSRIPESLNGDTMAHKKPAVARKPQELKAQPMILPTSSTNMSKTTGPEPGQRSAEDPTHKRVLLTLEKKPPNGFGIGLARDRKHEGVFIISLLPGGVADLDGRLQPGDEIKMVNGVDVSRSGGYSKAVELMSDNLVTVEVERKITPGKSLPSGNKSPATGLSNTLRSTENASDFKAENYEQVGPPRSASNRAAPKKYSLLEIPDPSPHGINDASNISASNSLQLKESPNDYNRNNNNSFIGGQRRSSEGSGIDGKQIPPGKDFESGVDVDLLRPPENEVVFIGREKSNNVAALPGGIQELLQDYSGITDDWLLHAFRDQFRGSRLKNYVGDELERLVDRMEAQLHHNQPLMEFRSLVPSRRNDLCFEGTKAQNKLKNRYQNILPFDDSRVILRPVVHHLTPEDDISLYDDYINASHIACRAAGERLNFIATQGPLLNTIADFWTMVWQNKVAFIAMLTKEFENDQNKTCQYWPDHRLLIKNRLEVMFLKHQALENFDVNFYLMSDQLSGESRLVSRSSFHRWPDQPSPKNTVQLVKFMSLMDELSGEGPPVVHCSAGIGRTGALIASKVCVATIKHDAKFDIKAIVEDLRKQRGRMVQTVQQYQLIYQVVLQVLETFLPAS